MQPWSPDLAEAARQAHAGRAAERVAQQLDDVLTRVRAELDAASAASARADVDGHLRVVRDSLARATELRATLAAQAHQTTGTHPVRRLVNHALMLAPVAEVLVRVDVPDGLRVDGNGAAVVQVLVELLDNAYLAVAAVGGPGPIEISAEVVGFDETVITVRDSGPGFDSSTLRPGVSAWGGGGLGLVFARDAAALALGTLELESGAGGTRASLRIVTPR